jgi:hypothetical protein
MKFADNDEIHILCCVLISVRRALFDKNDEQDPFELYIK